MRLDPEDQLDQMDEEHLRQVIQSRGFQLIADRVAEIRERTMQKLITADLAEVPGLQAAIRTLDLVAAIPLRLIQSMKEEKP